MSSGTMYSGTIIAFEDLLRQSNQDGTALAHYTTPAVNAQLSALARVSKTLFFAFDLSAFITSAGAVEFQLEIEHGNDPGKWDALATPVVSSPTGLRQSTRAPTRWWRWSAGSPTTSA